jgi:hypothetical protein
MVGILWNGNLIWSGSCRINDSDSINQRGTPDLILALASILNGAQWSGWHHGRRRWLAGQGPRGRYGPPNPTRFVPTASRWDGDSVLLTFKRRRAVWRAGGSNLLRKHSANNMGLLRRLSGSTNATDSFLLMPSCFPLWWIGSDGGGFLRMKNLGLAGLRSILGKIRVIHGAIYWGFYTGS